MQFTCLEMVRAVVKEYEKKVRSLTIWIEEDSSNEGWATTLE
jgi:hypothetical protein